MYSPYLGIGMSTVGPVEALVTRGCFLYVSKCDFFARKLFAVSAMKVIFVEYIPCHHGMRCVPCVSYVSYLYLGMS